MTYPLTSLYDDFRYRFADISYIDTRKKKVDIDRSLLNDVLEQNYGGGEQLLPDEEEEEEEDVVLGLNKSNHSKKKPTIRRRPNTSISFMIQE